MGHRSPVLPAGEGAVELLLFLVVVVVVLGASVVISHHRTVRREKAFRAVALELGLEYREEAPELAAVLADAGLLMHGRKHRVRNALLGERGPLRIALGELGYDVGSQRTQNTLIDSVCVLRTSGLDLPGFHLTGHSLLQTTLVGDGRDIDFVDDPEFSRAFELRGDDEAAIRGLFTVPVRHHLMSLAGRAVRLDAGKDTLVLAESDLLPAGELRALLERATSVLRELFTTAVALARQ